MPGRSSRRRRSARPKAEDRRKPYVDDPESASVFAGPVLTHSDWTPDNVLVSPRRAWLIDWLGSTSPPPWMGLMLVYSKEGMPKRSVNMAKAADQNVFWRGILTTPPSENDLKMRSDSATSFVRIDTEKP